MSNHDPKKLLINIFEEILKNKCLRFKYTELGTLILFINREVIDDFGDTTWRLWIDTVWRLQTKKKFIVGSFDPPDVVLSKLNIIIGCSIIQIECDEVTKDLIIEFEGGIILSTFSYSLNDEHWEIRKSDGLRIGVGENLEIYLNFVSSD